MVSAPDRYLLLIRHSAVVQVPDTPSYLWSLSADGRSRCHTLAPHLLPYQPVVFVTSIERKAVETGHILAEHSGVPCHTAAGLQEHDRRGTAYFPNKADFIATVTRLFEQPDTLVWGQETAVQARDRFIQGVQNVLNQYQQGNIAIVTHGTVLTLFLAHYNPQLDTISFWQNLALPDYFVVTLPDMRLLDSPPLSYELF